MIIVNNTTKKGGSGGGGLGIKVGEGEGLVTVLHVNSCPGSSRIFNMAVAGTAVCWQTKAIYFELETHMNKSRLVWILEAITEFGNAKVGKISFQPHTFIEFTAVSK